MNKRQKIIVTKLVIVIVVTAFSAVAIMNIKIIINKNESLRAMRQIGQNITNYKKTYGSLPPESYIERLILDMRAGQLLGKVGYRALWITPDSNDEQILAYTEKNFYSPFIRDGFILIRLNGSVEWMAKSKFDELLASQQGPMESQTKMLGK